MSQDSHDLWLLALLDQRVVQHNTLILEEPIPAHITQHVLLIEHTSCSTHTAATIPAADWSPQMAICNAIVHGSLSQCAKAGVSSGRGSHVRIAVRRPRGAIDDKELGERELQGPRQLLDLLPAQPCQRQNSQCFLRLFLLTGPGPAQRPGLAAACELL